MANCVVGWPRWTDRAVFTSGGGNWLSDYPVSNLGLLPLSRVARSADAFAASTRFLLTLDRNRPVRLLALVGHNLSLTARYRARFFSDTGATALAYDTGWADVWPPLYTLDSVEWEDDNFWSWTYTADQIAGYRWTLPLWLPQSYGVAAVRVEIDDQNNPDGYVQIGLCEIAQGLQAQRNHAFGAQYGYRSRTVVSEALGGGRYFDRRDAPRVWRGELAAAPAGEADNRWFELFRQADLDTPFLWLPDPADLANAVRHVFLARNAEIGLINQAFIGRRAVPLSFEEVL